MATEKLLNTRIILRNDSSNNWEAVKDTCILRKGEIAIEFQPQAPAEGQNYTTASYKPKVKIGDGRSTWAQLPYFGECEEPKVYQGEITAGGDKVAKIAELVGDDTLHTGDIAIIKEPIAGGKLEYTAFVYNGITWAAMDGNYSAENVFFKDDLVYTAGIGALAAPTAAEGSKTLAAAGKSVKDVFASILAQRKQPTKTEPTANFKIYTGVSNMTVEPGYHATGTVSYTLQLASAGSYTYGPATGVVESGTYSVTYDDGTTAGQTLTTKQGSFTYDFVVGTANKQVKVTASSVGHTAGAVAKDNLGDASSPEVKIAEGSKSAGTKTNTFTSSRKSFFKYDTVTGTTLHPGTVEATEKAADSALIRGLNAGEFGVKTSWDVTTTTGTKRIILAVPGNRTLREVIDVEGMGLDVKGNFTTYNNVYVGGCDATADNIGDYEDAYTVFVWENPATIAAHTYKIRLN